MTKRLFTLFLIFLACAEAALAGSGIFIRGGFNNWTASPDWEFEDQGGGVYTLRDKTVYGQFKVADASWSSACNYGGGSDRLTLGKAYALVAGTNSNITCGGTYRCAKITLTLSGAEATLMLEGEDATTAAELTAVYVIGSHNNWDFNSTSGKLVPTARADEFRGRVSFAAPAGESLCYWRIYEQLGMGGSWGNPGGANTSGHVTTGTLERGSEGCITTSPGTYVVTFNVKTGVFSCENEPSVASGVEVMPQGAVLVTEVPRSVRILSMNNSLIDRNDQPAIFNELARQMGKDALWTKHTLLGQSLLTHYNEGEEAAPDGTASARKMVRSQAWTHIILQEQSATPRTNLAEFRSSVRMWKEYIRAHCPNPNAVIIVPMNWAYSDDWSRFGTDSHTLYENYLAVAREQGVTLCPVSEAYARYFEAEGEAQTMQLYTDNRHPSLKASYMAACMEYALIYGEPVSTIGYKPEGLSEAEARQMRTYAEATMQRFANPVDHHAGRICFTAQIVDQAGQPMQAAGDVTWTVSGGGTLGADQVFTSDGTPGTYTVTARSGDLVRTARLVVARAVEAQQEETPATQPSFALRHDGTAYTQDFDAIGTAADAPLPEGWRIDRQLAAPRTVGTFAAASTHTDYQGGANLSPTAKNGLYNFGAGDGATAADRALGGISTGISGGTRCVNVYAHMVNDGPEAVRSIELEYDVEKYRNGNNAAGFCVQLYTSADGVSWASAGSDFYTYFAPDARTEGLAEVPSQVVHVKHTLATPIPARGELYLAWNITVAEGTAANAAMALAIDNCRLLPTYDLASGLVTPEASAGRITVVGSEVRFGGQASRALVARADGAVVADVRHATSLDIAHLPHGIYVVQAVVGGKRQVAKLMR